MNTPRLTHFIKFGAVGGSGVIVNLGALALLRSLGLGDNLASAIAIEISILSNFVLNERWTFRDRVTDVKVGITTGVMESESDPMRDEPATSLSTSLRQRAIRFQLVSLVGALVQWLSFISLNVFWVYTGISVGPNSDLWASYGLLLNQEGWQLLMTTPPRVGDWVYLSQLLGIIIATAWNFTMNVYWTWGSEDPSEKPSEKPS